MPRAAPNPRLSDCTYDRDFVRWRWDSCILTDEVSGSPFLTRL